VTANATGDALRDDHEATPNCSSARRARHDAPSEHNDAALQPAVSKPATIAFAVRLQAKLCGPRRVRRLAPNAVRR
jgi:hypothetical protein